MPTPTPTSATAGAVTAAPGAGVAPPTDDAGLLDARSRAVPPPAPPRGRRGRPAARPSGDAGPVTNVGGVCEWGVRGEGDAGAVQVRFAAAEPAGVDETGALNAEVDGAEVVTERAAAKW